MLTVIIDFSIIVFVSVPHQFLNVIFSDGFTRTFQHQLQFIKINVPVCIPVQNQSQTIRNH